MLHMQAARVHAETIANNLGLVGFARIDAFMGVEDGTLFVIEINTVPGLAPNNVLFQQALLEDPPIYPGEFCRLQVSDQLGIPPFPLVSVYTRLAWALTLCADTSPCSNS